MTWWWTRVYADDTTLSLSQCIQGCDLCVHWDNCAQKCKQFCEQLNRNTLTTGETTKGNCTKLCVLAHAGNLQFRFQQGPFTKRFRTVVTSSSRCAFHISVLPTRSHTCLVIRTEWITNRGDGDLQSLRPASSENVLVNLLLLHCGLCLWDWTFPHGSRKQQTSVCTD